MFSFKLIIIRLNEKCAILFNLYLHGVIWILEELRLDKVEDGIIDGNWIVWVSDILNIQSKRAIHHIQLVEQYFKRVRRHHIL